MHFVLADAYLHTLDPVLIPITETIGVRWYGLAYAAGFVIAWAIYWWFARTGRSPLSTQAVADLMFYGIIGVLVGGRVGYAVFYDPALLVTFTRSFPFWDLLAINKGGMASHGGILGVAAAVWLFSRKHGVPALHVLDIGAVAATPGLMLGRLANFVNAELIGRPVPDQADPPWWSVKFPQEMHRWPVDRLAELRNVVPEVRVSTAEWDAAIMSMAADPQRPPADAVNLVNFALRELVNAIQAGNEIVIEHVRPLLTAHYPSQIFQAISDGPVLFAVLALVWLKPRKPGVVGSTFLIAYGVLRIITEVFREPDAALVLGLSRGQALSVLMILAGGVILYLCAKRDVQALGGLRPAPVKAGAK